MKDIIAEQQKAMLSVKHGGGSIISQSCFVLSAGMENSGFKLQYNGGRWIQGNKQFQENMHNKNDAAHLLTKKKHNKTKTLTYI